MATAQKHIESHDITVKVVPGSEKYFDSVYITNSALIINDFAIMANYHKVNRRGEEELLAKYLKNKMGLRLRYLPKEEGVYFEGTYFAICLNEFSTSSSLTSLLVTSPPSLYCVKSVLSRRFLRLPVGILLGSMAPMPREALI